MLRKISLFLLPVLLVGSIVGYADHVRPGHWRGPGRPDGWRDPRGPGYPANPGYPRYPSYPSNPGYPGGYYDDMAAARSLYSAAMQLAQAAYMHGYTYLGVSATNLANGALQYSGQNRSFWTIQSYYGQVSSGMSGLYDPYLQQLFQQVTALYNNLSYMARC